MLYHIQKTLVKQFSTSGIRVAPNQTVTEKCVLLRTPPQAADIPLGVEKKLQ